MIVTEPIFRKPRHLTVALITGFWCIVLRTRVICIFAILAPQILERFATVLSHGFRVEQFPSTVEDGTDDIH